jgi:uncharacterized protein (DUF486 family)
VVCLAVVFWAKLDTTAGETAIQSYVTWGIANYTDATARRCHFWRHQSVYRYHLSRVVWFVCRMFNGSAMTIDNMDSTLRGWAKLDTTAGETAIQSYVTWGIANYTSIIACTTNQDVIFGATSQCIVTT